MKFSGGFFVLMKESIKNLSTYKKVLAYLKDAHRYCEASKFTVVLDTNILLDWLFWKNPEVLDLIALLNEIKASLLYTQETLFEFVDVIAREKFSLTSEEQLQLIQTFINTSKLVENTADSSFHCKDRDDQKFIDLAESTKINLLVSRDKLVLKTGKKLRRFDTAVLNVKDAVSFLTKERP